MPFYPVAAARRRLRRDRLLRRRRPLRDAGRLRGADPHGARPRHPRDRRPRARTTRRSTTRGSRPRARAATRRSATSTSGATRSRPRSRATSSSPTRRRSNWAWDDAAGPVVPAPLLLAPARPQRRQPGRSATSSRRSSATGSSRGWPGFRVDAVPFLLEPMGMPKGALHDPHELLKELRRYLSRRRGDAILLGEVNLDPPQVREFFGDARRAAHGVRLHRQPGDVPRARARRGGAAGRGAAGARRSSPRTASGRRSRATTTS